jgi:outer membrane receptor protein involved in Fe transport
MWKIGLDYKWSDTSMVYFGVNRGYKPGGIFIPDQSEISTFDAEWITSYEGGWKAFWLEQRVQTVVSVYYYDFTDKQMSYTRGYEDDDGEWQTEVLTTNAAGSENYGAEFEGTAFITQQLKVNLQYSWIHAEYTDFEVWDANLLKIVNLAGTPMDMAPKHKISLGGSYVYPTDFGNFVLHGTYMWQDEILSGIWADPKAWADPWDRLDAELSWVSPEMTWMVMLWGKNLTDQAQVYRATMSYDTDTPDPNDYNSLTEDVISPFQFGISITYKW